MTLTAKLAKKMATCKRMQKETLKDMAAYGKIAHKRHDQAAAMIADLDKQIEADPFNEELHTRRNEYDCVRGGLYAAVEYGKGLHEQVTGIPRPEHKEVDRHDTKDHAGLFTKKGSLGHRLAKMLGR